MKLTEHVRRDVVTVTTNSEKCELSYTHARTHVLSCRKTTLSMSGILAQQTALATKLVVTIMSVDYNIL